MLGFGTDGVFVTLGESGRGRVLSFSPVVGIGLPQPLTRRRVGPPPLVPGGGGHSLAREGVGESQFRRRDIHCGTLYIYVLCDVLLDSTSVIISENTDDMSYTSLEFSVVVE